MSELMFTRNRVNQNSQQFHRSSQDTKLIIDQAEESILNKSLVRIAVAQT